MAAPTQYRPGRILILLTVLVLGLTIWTWFPGQPHTPRLGLDLQGGTQVILAPEPINEGDEITEDQLNQAVEIIRQRVNGLGVSEADVAVQGAGNDAVIVVSVPGATQDSVVELVGRTALLDFREVDGQPLSPAPLKPDGEPIPDPPTPDGPQIVQAETDNAAYQTELLALNCTDPVNYNGGKADNPELWLGTCDRTGAAKYSLKPAFIRGSSVETASAQLSQHGAGGYVVTLDMDSEGASQLADVSSRLAGTGTQFAIVLDGVVVSAPVFSEAILGGTAQITGNFTQQEANDLANILKFGALPMELIPTAVESVTPTIGSNQLSAGILAGIIGLALVALYLLFYYRALGVVAGVSLLVAGWITYCAFVVLGSTIGFTLTLAGIAGAIVAVGITADSFVVYFERLRDEIRDGKSLRRAADDGWMRARRTLLAADFVSFLAAAVLYWLSVGNVRGFAFALGLTTIVDVIVAFWFTRPLVAIMTRSKWMQRGGALTGVSPKRLGVESLAGTQRPKEKRRRVPERVGASREDGDPDENNRGDGAVL